MVQFFYSTLSKYISGTSLNIDGDDLKDITFVIATRKEAKNKKKNIRKFGNSSLLEIKLK